MSVIIDIDIPVQEFERRARLGDSQAREANRQTAEALGKRALALFRSSVSTWRNKPEFTVETEASGDTITVLAGTDDPVYGYLDRGTSVRYAVMSADWRSKTRPGSLQSVMGRGRVVVISKRIPRPGIQARHFSEQIRATLDREAEPTYNRISKQVIR